MKNIDKKPMDYNREQEALDILTLEKIKNLSYLGSGHESVVYTDGKFVYKVILPKYILGEFDFQKAYRRKIFFLNISENLKHLYCIELIKTAKTYILKYKFEESEPCLSYDEKDAISFLAEVWKEKIIVKDCKPKNFIRVGKNIKLVDHDGDDYTDNLFLNMCARMYLYANFQKKLDDAYFEKLKRSAINNFDLPELSGLREFVNKVFSKIIFEQCNNIINKKLYAYSDSSYKEKILVDTNLEQLFFDKIKENKYLQEITFDEIKLGENNYFEPFSYSANYVELKPLEKRVSLLIKTCPQDINTIASNIKHIVRQLSCPNPFHEIVVSIDTKENDFLREYNHNGLLAGLVEIIDQLKNQNVIDRYIIFDETKTKQINKQWFNIDSEKSHTKSKAPLAPQLYGFEECKGDYIFQVDSDVLVGRKNYEHSFLTEMLDELDNNKDVLSVGFNIFNNSDKPYFGFENGGYVPEVRMGLLHKKRICQLLPLPNKIDDSDDIELTWHRSLHIKQKELNKCSIRGGGHNSFYIHPQNYRKKEPYAWLSILDRVEQNLIPDLQIGKFDLEGSLYDWAIEKRNEKIVVVSCFRNVSADRFLRFWHSLISQENCDFGIILLDDHSDNGLPFLIDSLIKPFKEKVTFIKKRNKSKRIENVHHAIHNYISNPDTIVIMLDGDDALIGQNVISNIAMKYDAYNADVVIGRMHQTYRLQPHYRYPVDFTNPRKSGGNVWQHLKTFKKYLFDSIPLPYFKYSKKNQKLYFSEWLETCDDFAFMVPIVEMCERPLLLDYMNYYYERNYEKRNEDRALKEKCIAEILNKPPLSTKNVFKERKTFKPNTSKIELDITYDCNLKCLGCNRSCTQAPSKEGLSLEDIKRFVCESIENNHYWEFINVLGGEPTLHSEFKEIISYIHSEYIEKFAPETILQIVSNGYEEKSRLLCEEMRNLHKNVRIDYGSYKSDKVVEYFSPFNDAPIDDDDYKEADYSKGCWVTSYCGIGFNSKGYYACAVAAGIDRLTKKNMEIKKLKNLNNKALENQLDEFCRFCGNFKAYQSNHGDFIPRVEKEPFKNIVTVSWKSIYKQNSKKK